MKTTQTGVGQRMRVRFPKLNKNNSLADNDRWAIEEGENVEECIVRKVILLNLNEWAEITNNFLTGNEIWENIGGCFSDDPRLDGVEADQLWSDHKLMNIFRDTAVVNVVRVGLEPDADKAINGDEIREPHFFVNTEGYNYARYVGRAA